MIPDGATDVEAGVNVTTNVAYEHVTSSGGASAVLARPCGAPVIPGRGAVAGDAMRAVERGHG
jgi:hypothetical protein